MSFPAIDSREDISCSTTIFLYTSWSESVKYVFVCKLIMNRVYTVIPQMQVIIHTDLPRSEIGGAGSFPYPIVHTVTNTR